MAKKDSERRLVGDELASRFGRRGDDRFDESFWTEVSRLVQHPDVLDRSPDDQDQMVRVLRDASLEVFDTRIGGEELRKLVCWTDDDAFRNVVRTIEKLSDLKDRATLVSHVRLGGLGDDDTGSSST